MKKVFGAMGLLAALCGTTGTAQAAPSQGIQEFDCGGVATQISVGHNGWIVGRNGWSDGVNYQAVSVTLIDFDGNVVFVKVYGGGHQLADPDAVTCTAPAHVGRVEVVAVAR